MQVRPGTGTTDYGAGVDVFLTGDEVASAIAAYVAARGVIVTGPRTITVNGGLCGHGRVYVDPCGYVIADGILANGSKRRFPPAHERAAD